MKMPLPTQDHAEVQQHAVETYGWMVAAGPRCAAIVFMQATSDTGADGSGGTDSA